MTKVKLVNENGVIKGIDPDTGNEVPIEFADGVFDSISANEVTNGNLRQKTVTTGTVTQAGDILSISVPGTDFDAYRLKIPTLDVDAGSAEAQLAMRINQDSGPNYEYLSTTGDTHWEFAQNPENVSGYLQFPATWTADQVDYVVTHAIGTRDGDYGSLVYVGDPQHPPLSTIEISESGTFDNGLPNTVREIKYALVGLEVV
ncbi:hypothetical protein [Halobellus rubicundus]|uniref:Uncharacterized protein n=1 Tax=Halobellus rubicundus TaxID=2996466 RepID=A0ABD5MDT5_9EURY